MLIKVRLIILLGFSEDGLACKYEIILQVSLYNSTRNCIFLYLTQQLPIRQGYTSDLIQFTFKIKDVFSWLIFEVDFVLKTIYVCLVFLQIKLHKKQESAKERTHLFLFIKCMLEKIKEEKQ